MPVVRKIKIPVPLMREFEAIVRKRGDGHNGTITPDIAIFKDAITRVLSKPQNIEQLMNGALKNAKISLR